MTWCQVTEINFIANERFVLIPPMSYQLLQKR